MRWLGFIWAVWFSAGCVSDAFSETQEYSLWQKAVRIAEANTHWLPGEIEIQEITRNKKGKTESESNIVINLTLAENGDTLYQLIQYEENGRDETCAHQETFVNELDLRDNTDDFNPFMPQIQEQLKVCSLNQIRKIGRRICSGFKFEAQGYSEQKGIAWLDQNAGYPVLIETVLPNAKEGSMEMKNIHSAFYFQFTQEGQWLPEKEVVTLSVQVKTLLLTWQGNTCIQTFYRKFIHGAMK